MRIISNDDTYADALSSAAFATIPFIAIGVMDNPVVLYISASLGIIFFVTFLIRFIINLKIPSTIKTSNCVADLVSLLQFPYVVALASLIFTMEGIDMTVGLWLSLAIAIGATLFVILDRD